MVTPIDFGGHSSKVKFTMGIIDKCGVRGDATLCVVIFTSGTHCTIFLLESLNYFEINIEFISMLKNTFGAPLHTLSKLYDVPVGFVTPPIFRLCIALFAVAKGWLLLNIR